ncbi:flavin reductase family protein [Streptomyces sp. MAR4 CNY-716]
MTANSLLSISLHPPTLLISLQRGSRTQPSSGRRAPSP